MWQNYHFQFGLSVCLLAFPSSSGDEVAIYSYGVESEFVTTVTSESLARAPAWREINVNPPVSARKAIQLARDVKKSLVEDTNGWEWHLTSVALKRFDPMTESRWYWQVTYEAFQLGGMTGPPRELHIVVRMDGTVAKPSPVELPVVEFGGHNKSEGQKANEG